MIEVTAQTVIFWGRIPSKKNSKQLIVRRSPKTGKNRPYVVSSSNYAKWHKNLQIDLLAQKIKPMQGKISVSIKFYAPDVRRWDLTNKAESIMDALVDYGIIPDDSVDHCPIISLEHCGIDKKHPRAEVELVNIE